VFVFVFRITAEKGWWSFRWDVVTWSEWERVRGDLAAVGRCSLLFLRGVGWRSLTDRGVGGYSAALLGVGDSRQSSVKFGDDACARPCPGMQ